MSKIPTTELEKFGDDENDDDEVAAADERIRSTDDASQKSDAIISK